MPITRSLRVSCLLVAVAACSSSTASDGGAPPEGGASISDGGGVEGGLDAAPEQDPVAAPQAALELKTAGALPTTIVTGAFTPLRGRAQVRTKPNDAGSITSIVLGESAVAGSGRSLEITLYDDAGALTAGEKFTAEAPNGVQLRKARVHTWLENGDGWLTGGDGSVTVTAIDAESITLEFTGMGQFARAPRTNDTFVLSGTAKVAIAPWRSTSGGTASAAIGNVQPEPGSGDAANVTGAANAVASTAAGLGDVEALYVGSQRTLRWSDTQGAVSRNVHIVFPSGHLPQKGQLVDLSKFDSVNVRYFEGAALDAATPLWEADKGTAEVKARTATSLTLELTGVRMQSESPSAKGVFDLAGTVTVPIAE